MVVKKTSCPNCGTPEGKLHKRWCDLEICQLCRKQFIICMCDKKERKKARVPFILYPQMCAKCGELWPKFFMVSNEEWEFYIQPDMRNKIICYNCYEYIKEVIDGGVHTLPGFRWID
jgi:hypothetical protein